MPKREFRAAWIATVSNIDWPSRPGLPAAEQQHEYIDRLNRLRNMGCNAVIVQIRPAADAFYPSAYEPWSRFLTSRQGQAPMPEYDPLLFMIEQAHARHMEFHAWFNPFRALTDARKNPNPPSHVTRQHPDWLLSYGGKGYLDPGIPAARDYVLGVIADVVRRYDIDAVHLDDYFYPYPVGGAVFPDSRSYNRYGEGQTKADWRRSNVNTFIDSLHSQVRALKPWVKIGISPFGVWRNAAKDPEGSPTRGGLTNYDDLYADVLLWQRNGWIDYMMPQLYWEHGHRLVAFDVLHPWWEAHSYGRHVYYGLGVYRMLEARAGTPYAFLGEIMSQLRDIRTGRTPGYALYSASNFDKLRQPLADSITRFAAGIALPPVMKWLDSIAPRPPYARASAAPQGTLLRWEAAAPVSESVRFLIYRFDETEQATTARADHILTLTSSTQYLDIESSTPHRYTYLITALDRLWNESAPAIVSLKQ
jgi:uncharacterized lipoprotein YddW (UPF0748 family)